jgi:tetratricopeptide (TPR) repeat protein
MNIKEIFNRIDVLKKKLDYKPFSPVLNVLYLSYNLLANDFKTIEDQSENYSINTLTPCTLCDTFRGIVYLNNSQFSNANVVFKSILDIDPEDHYAYLFKGIVNLEEGKNAKELFEKAVTLAPDYEKEAIMELTHAKEHEKLSIILSEENTSRKEFLEVLKELEKSTPNDPILKVALADSYAKLSDFKNAITILEGLNASFPDYPHALYLLGNILEEHFEDHKKAEECFEKILKINPLSKYRVIPISLATDEAMDDLNELLTLYKQEKPIIKFIQEHFHQLITDKETTAKETATIEHPTEVIRETEKEITQTEQTMEEVPQPEPSVKETPKPETSAKSEGTSKEFPEIEKTIQKPTEAEEKFEKPPEPMPQEEAKKIEEIEPTFQETQPEQKPQEDLEYGRSLIKEKKYKEAVEFFLNNLKKSQEKS